MGVTRELPMQVDAIQASPRPLALVMWAHESVSSEELYAACQRLREALGEGCPPIVLLPPGVTFEAITDPARVPGWWEKKGR